MQPIASISQIASLMADPKRSAMLWALIDGMARPSEELAMMAGLTPSSACAHLARLSAGGLLKREARGRKRYFRLAAPEIGTAVEALASVGIRETKRQPRTEEPVMAVSLAMRKARLCRDHLGGEVAAELLLWALLVLTLYSNGYDPPTLEVLTILSSDCDPLR